MKINNSAELAQLIGQVVLFLHSNGSVIIPEEFGYTDFERANVYAANSMWASFERGTLDISATPEEKEYVDFLAGKADLDLPTDADVMDHLEARMQEGK